MQPTALFLTLALSSAGLSLSGGALADALEGFEYRVLIKGLVVDGNPVSPTPTPLSLSLREAALDPATVGQTYSFDFRSLLELSGGNPIPPVSGISWGSLGGLPAGLQMDLHTGVLSGTPTSKNATGAVFEVFAAHGGVQGTQTYTLVINGVPLRVLQVVGGNEHTCALTVSGGVKCWGLNGSGQLGDGSTQSRNIPTDVTGLTSGVVSIAAGYHHTCALTTAGGVKCWGAGAAGQLGYGGLLGRTLPENVQGLSTGVAGIAAGMNHTCAVTTGGAAFCWGLNGSGQLGDATTLSKSAPVAVSGLSTGVSRIFAGYYHSCALTTHGGVLCWGQDDMGQLGNDMTFANQLTPVPVTGLSTGVAALTAGVFHNCAIGTGGGLKCWGADNYGQLGNNTTLANQPVPADVQGLGTEVSSVTAGGHHTCAVTTTGVKCWGRNSQGQLGVSGSSNRPVPVDVQGLTANILQIGMGYHHTCAISTDTHLRCWGLNSEGQLGIDTRGGTYDSPQLVIP